MTQVCPIVGETIELDVVLRRVGKLGGRRGRRVHDELLPLPHRSAGDGGVLSERGVSTIPARGVMPVLPGYAILRVLGRGDAAVAYLARQEALDRQVAVKVLRRDVEDPKVWRAFRREAHAVAHLSAHPHVVTVYTAGRSGVGQPYLVTEYLDGGSLADVIANVRVDAHDVATIGDAVAGALAAAHDLGILHRDVKPGNVLLAHDGRIKLGDFGIARLLVGQSAATTDQIAFTPEHVAPEVLRNEPEGPWSDVYDRVGCNMSTEVLS